jgi:hypothetical protein
LPTCALLIRECLIFGLGRPAARSSQSLYLADCITFTGAPHDGPYFCALQAVCIAKSGSACAVAAISGVTMVHDRARDNPVARPSSGLPHLASLAAPAFVSIKPQAGPRRDLLASPVAIMPKFTIESTDWLPVFRQRSYDADTVEDACRRH